MKLIRIIFTLVFFVSSNYSFSQWLPTGTSTTAHIYRSGNIGIGTTAAPIAPLQFGNGIMNRKIVLYQGAGITDNTQFCGFGLQNGIMRYSIDLPTSHHVFYVGTGVNLEQELLRIKGTGTLQFPNSGTYALLKKKIVLYESAPNDYQYLGFGVQPGMLKYQVGVETDDHVFYAGLTSTTEREIMRMKGNGNVGIGLASPTEKLHVGGNIRVENTGGIYLNWTSGYESGKLQFGNRFSMYYATFPHSSAYNGLFLGPPTLQSSFYMNNSGNIGLGTTDASSSPFTRRLNINGSTDIMTGDLTVSNGNAFVSGLTGCGTSTPSDKLHVSGGILRVEGTQAVTSSGTGNVRMGANGTAYSWIQSGGNPLVLNPLSTGAGNDYVAVGFTPGTGITVPSGYKLAINGKVICTELKVKLSGNWPDYVFSPAYNLMPLDSVATYIDHNHHLPEIPSAKELEENGVNTGEMNALMMKKIEELTLYMIEQKKEIDLLKVQNKVLQQKVEILSE